MYNKIQTRGARKQFAAGDARFHAFDADYTNEKRTLANCNTSQNPTTVLSRKFLKFSRELYTDLRSILRVVRVCFSVYRLCGNSGRKESFPARRGAVTFVLSGAEGARHSWRSRATYYLFRSKLFGYTLFGCREVCFVTGLFGCSL